MYINTEHLIGIGAAAAVIALYRAAAIRNGSSQSIKTSGASLTSEELEEYAKKVAIEHSVTKRKSVLNWPLVRMNDNYNFIRSLYVSLNEDARKKRSVPPAAEWLLDNFYIIEEQTKSIRRDMGKSEYARLPILKQGVLKNQARIYAVATELVAHTDGQVSENIVLNYLKAYQLHSTLYDREIWALPTMLRLALIERVRNICEKVKDTRHQWKRADEITDSWLDNEGDDAGIIIKSIESKFKDTEDIHPAFIEHLSFRLRRTRRGYTQILKYIDESLNKYGMRIEEINQKEHNSQSVSTVSMGNCVTSLKFVTTFDWIDIFERSSLIEEILSKDPDGTYPGMDFTSRTYYRKRIEELASVHGVSELHIAREVIRLASSVGRKDDKPGETDAEADGPLDNRDCHIGYYLIGNGTGVLQRKLGDSIRPLAKVSGIIAQHPIMFYLGPIILISLLITVFAANYSFHVAAGYTLLLSIIAGVAVLVPSSEIAVCMVNWIVCNIKKPAVFPKMELKDGIPDELSTVVVIPALLPDEKRVKELLGNLERHYLANREENLYFALVGDFKDFSDASLPEDEKIIGAGLRGIKELNLKYARKDQDKFYYFHRERRFNKSHGKWMGWERKRGALLEFNELLLGSRKTSFCYSSGILHPASEIKYVITLDADTILPIGMARKMIGAIAHPLNRPVIDKNRGIVKEGYGLIQPRISFDIDSTNKSLFSRIFTGQEGLDPYASAISDVYQDLFCEGIFTGKGIYHLSAFQGILKNAIPENSVLCHDLLEGSYIRTGLATDLELIDAYPSRYNSYAARQHRWVRGDWQIITWLFNRVHDRHGNVIRNPLSPISRWKIFDNLRRTLVSPALMILLALGFCILPGSSLIWLGFALFTLVFPLITAIISRILAGHFSTSRIKRHIPVISGLKAAVLQVVLAFVFLPHQAYLMAHAAIVSLVRVFITRKNMIEWVTAADVEKGQKNSLKSYWMKMRTAVAEAAVIVILAYFFKPDALAAAVILLGIWCASPFAAYYVSKVYQPVPYKPSIEDLRELRIIARKTWRYFEEFAGFKNHFLAPDNYQEDPPRGVAHRSSPTNIGLGLLAVLSARDMGYMGIHEMTELISKTVSTIEKMEKWNGHLYNWYDTRTLQPLRPRYISTVDSGNFVGYLITLSQGLKEYLNAPLVDTGFAEGIRDTFGLTGSGGAEVLRKAVCISEIESTGSVDIVLWNRALNELFEGIKSLNTKKSSWASKAEHMVRMFKRELTEFMPWVDLLDTVPQELLGNPSVKKVEEVMGSILRALKGNPCLRDLPRVCRDVQRDIDKLARIIKVDVKRDFEDGTSWLARLREEVSRSIENTEKFICRYRDLGLRIESLSDATEFLPLYVEKKQLFSIGYNIEENRLTNSYYDLLASEARQTSYIAIARGEVPPAHWFKLGRALTVVDSYKGLVSWTGTMFEYLMPLVTMKSYKNTLLDETYSFVIRSQKKYGRQRGIPWGASESGFYSLDINLDYQYKAIGVPWLGLKRGLAEDAVVAPYSTFLALLVDPEGAVENIRALASEGVNGPYGFYEAIDYTPERLPFGLKSAVIKSFMAHHQGMSLLSLNNYFNDFIMQKRFHSDPVIRTAQLLLQEKVPANLVVTKETKERIEPFKDVVYKEKGSIRKFSSPDLLLPKVHLLSNGNYSVMITDRGTGYSRCKIAAVTRWREDSSLDNYGMFFYVRNMDTNDVWSTAYSPLNTLPEKYEAIFTADKARFRRRDGSVETETEVIVTSGDNAEIRRISFKNFGQSPCVMEVTSYFEVVLAPQAADVAHPAFSNLFVKTEFLTDRKCIIANRRPRSEADKSLWIANKAVVEGETVGDVQFETDRAQFIGRGHTVSAPEVIVRGRPLSNTFGPVLDPVMSLRLRLRVEPGKTAAVSFVTAVSESSQSLMKLIERYDRPEAIEGAFKLAFARGQVEVKYLNIKASEAEVYQEMLSHILFISPLRRLYQDMIEHNSKGQSSLWPYGISGDLPVVLVELKKSDEVDMLYEALKMHEYWRLKELRVDLLVLNNEENSYTHPMHALLSDIVSSSHAHDIINKPGGVFILNMNNLPVEDICLLYAAARMVFKGDRGSISDQVKKIQEAELPEARQFLTEAREYGLAPSKDLKLHYFNGLGGFSEDGREYVIRLEKNQNTPMPWVNVIANSNFGFIATESGSGYTWCENSRENKLTPWSNDPVSDVPGEIFYMSDSHTGELWTLTPLPIREEEPYTIRHGFGYSAFEHTSHGIEQSLVQFVPVSESLKASIVRLKNTSKYVRNFTLTYYIRPVIGVSDQQTAMHIRTRQSESGALLVENPYNEEFAGRIAFIDVSEKERSVTGDKKEFFGSGGIGSPESLKRKKLSGNTGLGYDPCAAMQICISLQENEEREVVFLFGMTASLKEIGDRISRYKKVENAKKELIKAKNFWKQRLEVLQVSTPDISMNIMLNGWLVYQVISCRMWARSAFYQSGGAFGFRDQLQDCLAVAQTWPEIAHDQILLHARHQFVEGDVQHWWHEPKGKGTRTRFSDDLLWLPYVVAEYLRITGDSVILDSEQSFVQDELLKEFEDEKYSIPVTSTDSSSLYDHCVRAIEKSLKFGEHGLPLMGSGDWNDGMNTVGNGGKGESVWLGWFLYSVLVKFSQLCIKKGDTERAESYTAIAGRLSEAIEKNAWDGCWYRRAYFDNGIPLGSVENSECKIDAIAQAWAVISGAGDRQRAVEAMNSLENYLVQREEGLIKLLTPPFDEGELEPGYIKSYVPGVRENGGQYTHAAAWAIIAFANMGDGDKAWEFFELINPVNHARTPIEYSKYKVEPYVMAADVYAVHPHVGRGGWTWYTGSAGWVYRAGMEEILGFRKNGDVIVVDPCIPKKWAEYSIKYKYLDTFYEIVVKNPEGVNKGVKKVSVDGNVSEDKVIHVVNDGIAHHVEVYMGKQ